MITCSTNAYTVGGTLTGISTGTLVLQNNLGDNLNLTTNGIFTFATGIANAAAYSVTVLTNPTNRTCTVTNPSGTISAANIADVTVTCTGNANGSLSNGTNINPLTLTGGVTTHTGAPCANNTAGCAKPDGYVDSATPSSVRFKGAVGVTTDGTNLFIAERDNYVIRKIVISSGVVTTIISGNNDLTDPKGLLIHNNNLYVAEGSGNAIRQINLSTNILSTVLTGLNDPFSMALVGTDIYIANKNSDTIVKTTIGTWGLSTFAGSTNGFADGTGTAAQFKSPEGITTDGTNLYVSDTGNHVIRKIVISSAVVTTLVGANAAIYTNSSISANARFDSPRGITSDGLRLYLIDLNNAVRRIE